MAWPSSAARSASTSAATSTASTCSSVEQLRYVVVELRRARDPSFLGQLGTYVAVVDDRLRRPDRHAPTVGILLCTGGNTAVVRYALSAAAAPVAVATYEALSPDERAGLPDPAELTATLDEVLNDVRAHHSPGLCPTHDSAEDAADD